MSTHIDISPSGFSFTSIVQQINDYAENLKLQKIERKTQKLEATRDKEVKAIFDNFLYSPKAQKKFFDFVGDLIDSEGQKLLNQVDKELAMFVCENLEESNVLESLIKSQDAYDKTDFDELEDFYTYKSFMSLVHKITDFYENMKEKSHELESEDYFIFIEQEINKSIKGSKRHAIHSIEGFLNDL